MRHSSIKHWLYTHKLSKYLFLCMLPVYFTDNDRVQQTLYVHKSHRHT